jgi:hypothetical protein
MESFLVAPSGFSSRTKTGIVEHPVDWKITPALTITIAKRKGREG